MMVVLDYNADDYDADADDYDCGGGGEADDDGRMMIC